MLTNAAKKLCLTEALINLDSLLAYLLQLSRGSSFDDALWYEGQLHGPLERIKTELEGELAYIEALPMAAPYTCPLCGEPNELDQPHRVCMEKEQALG